MSLESTLFKGERVWNLDNIHELIPEGVDHVVVNGEKKFLAYQQTEEGRRFHAACEAFGATFRDIPASEYDARIDEQIARKARVSDHITWEQFNQDGLPTCWAINTTQAGSTTRVLDGYPFVRLTGVSAAVEISGGHSGGDEADAIEYGLKRGFAPEEVYPENNTSRSLIRDPKVEAARPHFKITKALRLETRANWATVGLLSRCGPGAYNRMRHVMMYCDFVRIERGRYGFRFRNSWFPWGAKNDHGVDGFAVYEWTPDSGFVVWKMVPSPWKPAA